MKNLSKALTIILLLTIALTFVACSDAGDDVGYIYGVYVKSVDVVDGVCTVRLSRTESDLLVGESAIDVSLERGGFYDVYVYDVGFDGKAIFSAVKEGLAQNGMLLNGQKYSTLKIIYDYDTIYKSMESDGNRSVYDGTYTHSFNVDKAPFEVQLTRRVARQSMWYAVAIVGAVALLAGCLTGAYIRGKYGRKEEN